MKNEMILDALQNLVDSWDGPQFREAFHDAAKVLKAAKAAAPERKIVQIASVDGWLVSLCNDGTAWKLYPDEWELLPPIPQGDAP